MYSDKRNVLQLVALLKQHKVKQVVLCPGSRNSPVNHSIASDPFFQCYSVIDERSAGFFAIGLILRHRQPVAVCCTSGSAVLNLAPAVSEAYYQELPLLVISADRPPAWIGQADGQTLPQPGIFNSLVHCSVQLNEPVNEDDEWYCNRMINEAILSMNHCKQGPAHINIPLSEPLYNFNIPRLPQSRKINRITPSAACFDYAGYKEKFLTFPKIVIVAGQLLPDNRLQDILEKMHEQYGCLIIAEHLSNIGHNCLCRNFDPFIYSLSDEDKECMQPDLVISIGGHIVSRRIKEYIRSYPPAEHWHISTDGAVTDLFQCLTDVIESAPIPFFEYLLQTDGHNRENNNMYAQKWMSIARTLPEPSPDFSDLQAVEKLIHSLPAGCSLHLANSSSVRYAHLFKLPEQVRVFCNRGTSGIEGSLSTAVGYAATEKELTFLLTGDLSFFYDMTGLWNEYLNKNLRILVNNNQTGEIFHALPGLNRSEQLTPYITGLHSATAKEWAESRGFTYLAASDSDQLEQQMKQFTQSKSDAPVLLEVLSTPQRNIEIIRSYYHQLKKDTGL